MIESDYSWPLMKDTLTWRDRWNLAKFVMTADRFTQGKKVCEFEDEWSRWLKAHHSLFVTSGSTANFLLLDAVREYYFPNQKEIKVLLPACTWVTNVNPVIQLGMTPVFCDINLYNYSFDEDRMIDIAKEHRIDIVFTTHLLGQPANLPIIKALFPEAIHLDDVCESHGASISGKKVGSDSIGSTFSFYYGHHMSTIEGGMISTNNIELYNLMKMKRSHGMSRLSLNPHAYARKYPDIDPQFLFVTSGYNFRNTEIAAVLGLSQLKRLDDFIEIRQKNFDQFIGIIIRSGKFHDTRYVDGNSSFCFPLIAKDKKIRKLLVNKLKENGIEYRPIVGGNLLRQPYLKHHYTDQFPNADILHENGVYIGNNQFVGKKELNILEDIIRSL